MPKDNTGFFAMSTATRLAMIPAAAPLASYGNGIVSGERNAAAPASRMRASLVNGAQSPANPVNAPWSFFDFISGNRSMRSTPGTKKTTVRGR